MAHSIDPAAGAVRGFVPARNDEERYLMRHIEDLSDAAFSRGIARYSAFLSDREQDLARAALGRAGVRDGWRFDGGWPEAERRVLCLEPEYSYGECPVRCVQLQCRALPGAALPAHKDYLGSLMGLALKREALGDILLPADAPGTAYVFALEPAAKLICRELCQAGRTEVSTHLLEPEEIPAFPAPERQLLTATVSSLRLDAVAASALRALLLERGRERIAAWEPRLGVRAESVRVHDAKSRWGSCNVRTRSIMLALSLAHYPSECLELICVHELCHLIERGHGPRFRALMDRHLPDWREREALLRRLSQGR